VPPVAPTVYVDPSEPVSVTCVAFVAVIVRIDELPAVIDEGVAVIVTVGVADPADETVMVEFAVAEPPGPVAVAVYVVVAAGLTVCVPPASGKA